MRRQFGFGPNPESEATRKRFQRFRSLKPIFVVAIETGLRKMDLLNLEWTQVDLVGGFIRLLLAAPSPPRRGLLQRLRLGAQRPAEPDLRRPPSRNRLRRFPSPRADGVVVTGPVTRNLETAVHRTVEAIPEPRIVIAVGACAASGGASSGRDTAAPAGLTGFSLSTSPFPAARRARRLSSSAFFSRLDDLMPATPARADGGGFPVIP